MKETTHRLPPLPDPPSAAEVPATPSPEPALPEIPGYRFLRSLGQGAMGAVFLAIEESLERQVAVKLLAAESVGENGAHQQFVREAKTMATVEHPHVVRLYAFGDAGQSPDTAQLYRPYLVMEYVEGETLEGRIARGKLELRETLRITRETTEALRAAWRRRIVHRDVKPGNILLDEDGRVRVGDFGIAKPLDLGDGAYTASGITLGTPHYISPEQASGETVDFRSDMYSLGVVTWEMLTGHRPFSDSNSLQLLKRHLTEKLPPLRTAGIVVPPGVEQLVERMTAKDRDHRFASYDDLLAALAGLGNDGQAQVQATPLPPSIPERPKNEDPASEALKWYYLQEGARAGVGPMPQTELMRLLATGRIGIDTLVWTEGLESWQPATGVTALTTALPSPRPAPAPPAPPSAAAVTREQRQVPVKPLSVGRPALSSGPAPPPKSTGPSSTDSQFAKPPTPVSSPLGNKPALPRQPSGSIALRPQANPLVPKQPLSSDSRGLDDVLSAVDAKRDYGREQRLRRGIQRAHGKVRFEDLIKSVFKPALRQVMARFHTKGYPTRLHDKNKNEIHLELILGSKSRCCLKILLNERGRVAFRFEKNMSPVLEEEVPLHEIDAVTIDRRLADLLSRGLGLS